MSPINLLRSIHISSSVRTILGNASALATANIGIRALALLYIILLTRQAGIEGVGAYSLATAVGAYIFLLADFGLNNYVIQYGSADRDRLEHLYNLVLKLKLVFLPIVLPAVVLLSLAFGENTSQQALIGTISAGFVLNSFSKLNYAVLRAHEKMLFEAVFSFLASVFFVIAAYAVLEQFEALYWVGVAFLLTRAAEFAISNWTRKELWFSSNLASVPVSWQTFTSGLPFGITSVVSTAFTQIDVLIIALVASVGVVGEYTIVSRLLLATSVIPIVLGASVWPKATQLYSAGSKRFRRLVTAFIGLNLVIAVALLLVISNLAETIITEAYGNEYLYLAPLLRIGSFFILFKFLSLSIGYVVTSADRQKQRALAVLGALVITVILVIALVPTMGVAGAVWSLLISEIALTLGLSFFARDLFLWRYVFGMLTVVSLAALLGVHVSRLIVSTTDTAGQVATGLAASAVYFTLLTLVTLGVVWYANGMKDEGIA